MGLNQLTESQTPLDVNDREKNPEIEDDYNPDEQAPSGKTASYFETLLILVKASLGTGILGMPRAFYNAGYVLGTVGTIFSGILTTATAHMISKTQHELCRRKRIPRMTYPEVVEVAFELGPGNAKRYKHIARKLCNLSIVLIEFGSDTVYAIFMAINIKEICNHFLSSPQSTRFYLLCLLVPMILVCLIRNLKYLAPGSTIGTGCAIGCVGVIYYYIFSQPFPIKERKAYGSMKEFSLFFGTILFAVSCYGVMIPLKNSMTKPKHFGGTFGVVNTAMIPNVCLYVIMGCFGYLAYGDKVQSSVTLNLPQVGLIGDLIRILMTGSIFATYPICNHVIVELLWHKNLKLRLGDSKHLTTLEYIFRAALTCVTFACCIAIPNLELVMSLCGSLMVPMLGIYFPVIIHTLTFWSRYNGLKFALFIFRAIVITLIGLFAFVVSFSTTVEEIVKTSFSPE